MAFSFKEKLSHYKAVAKGDKKTKTGSKFSKKEQQAYARGQVDARNEQRRVTAFKNATSEQRQAYKQSQREKRAAYKASQEK